MHALRRTVWKILHATRGVLTAGILRGIVVRRRAAPDSTGFAIGYFTFSATHSVMVRSFPPEASSFPSGEKATAVMS